MLHTSDRRTFQSLDDAGGNHGLGSCRLNMRVAPCVPLNAHMACDISGWLVNSNRAHRFPPQVFAFTRDVVLGAGRLANGRKVVAEWNRHANEALGGCGGHGCLRRASEEAQALLGPKGAVWSRRYDHRNESLVSCHELCEMGAV
jgi:hypothetical protein